MNSIPVPTLTETSRSFIIIPLSVSITHCLTRDSFGIVRTISSNGITAHLVNSLYILCNMALLLPYTINLLL
ncbi:putative B ORF D [Vaccinia virus Copenhagen]|uniref:Uncharacterized 7.8 kDa protein n=5 Tax=Vaccinia virus TaxID=10245 RepID=YVBD_VACCW|nr:RecName: Full=Uncharacterized 7.8 kDa protein [Vaccinia virus WR]P68475.1 RecName: Full=Uncharacterized 7.8 kDa protein [Vaccinia virus Copenhagen]AAW23634.1 hypothetical protein m8245L [Vaccinia virus]ABZ80163.1 unknown [synthetic Vaccinia virus]BBD06284.1 putative B ORF D [BAC cloning vector pLC16m8.8S-BAC]AAA48203.1 putative B ORF D [Vaccinia virus Copenhagen]AAW23916.1 hypothetical protein mO245L [Vaccinia virus]